MRIGVIGAGQLGQMLGFAARKLGDDCTFLDLSINPPAAAAGEVVPAAFDDLRALGELAASCDVLTYEFENVPVGPLRQIAGQVSVYPPVAALHHAQDRLLEKRLFSELDIPVANYRPVDSRADLDAAAAAVGLPLVLKTRRLGYDGKGQIVIRQPADIDSAWNALGDTPLIAEAWIDFDFEVSAIGARAPGGEMVIYPLTENQHADGILRVSRAPVQNEGLSELAAAHLGRLLERLDYVGVAALEFFVVDDALTANEFAPRVHNSGHWTIEGAVTSQFSNHIRAITDRKLGSPAARGHAIMINLIGDIPSAALAIAKGHLHDYGKAPRVGRKLGHVTAVADSAESRDLIAEELLAAFGLTALVADAKK